MMKNKKLKVCIFGTYDRNFTSNKIVINGLKENNVEVLEVNSEIKVTRLDKDEDMTWWKLMMRVLRKYKIVTEVIKNYKGIRECQVLYVGYPGHIDVLPAYLVAKFFDLKLIFNPLVVIYTGFADDQGILKKGSIMGSLTLRAEKFIYSLCDLVMADTPYQKRHLMDIFGMSQKRIKVLPIGADDKVYPYSPKKKNDHYFNVVYYGLYTPLHGVEYIVQAANILKNDKSIKFLMVGNGHTFDENLKRARKLKLKNMIFYKDMTETDALRTLAKADVFLGFLQKHPSVNRIVPNKVYQGMALGKAVVSADSPAIRSVLKDKESVLLCKQANGKDLARAIKELWSNPVLKNKIAKKGCELFKRYYTPKSVGRILEGEMREIISI